MKTYEGKPSALMSCQCQAHRFRTLILRGADLSTLAAVKRVLLYGLHVLQVIDADAAASAAAAAAAAAASAAAAAFPFAHTRHSACI